MTRRHSAAESVAIARATGVATDRERRGRLDKFFDRVAAVQELRVSAITVIPRELNLSAGGASFGMPVYTTGGGLVGVLVMQMPDSEDSDGGPFAMLRVTDSMAGGVILPAPAVVKATVRARETAAGREEEDLPSEPADAETDSE